MNDRRYAIFVSSTWNYVQYLNALVNSIQKRRLFEYNNLDVHVIYTLDFPDAYLDAISNSFDYNLIAIGFDREKSLFRDEQNKNRIMKFARFEYMRQAAMEYDVVCMLDADMMIVSPEFMNLFDLVYGTDKLIGCNEHFKWTIGDNEKGPVYKMDDPILFPDDGFIFTEPTLLWKFHCSVPIIFNMTEWDSVFDFYLKLVSEGYEVKNGKQIPMGDIFSWNTAVRYMNKQNDLILFPMEVMTQVHYTNTDPNRRVIDNNGYWHTWAGDPVYSLHGRVDRDRWVSEHWRVFERNNAESEHEKLRPKIAQTLEMIKREWDELNDGKVKLSDFLQDDNREQERVVEEAEQQSKVRVYA